MKRVAALAVVTLWIGPGALGGCGAGTKPLDDGDIDGDADSDADSDADGDSDGDSDADSDGDGGAPCDEGTLGPIVEAEIIGLAFAPFTLEIAPGSRVRWTNFDSVAHSVTEGAPEVGTRLWDSGLLSPGQTFERTFCEVGEWTYFDTAHPNMMRDAVVRVQ